MEALKKILEFESVENVAKEICSWDRAKLSQFMFMLSDNFAETGIAMNAVGNLDDGQAWQSIGAAAGIAATEIRDFIQNKLK